MNSFREHESVIRITLSDATLISSNKSSMLPAKCTLNFIRCTAKAMNQLFCKHKFFTNVQDCDDVWQILINAVKCPVKLTSSVCNISVSICVQVIS